MFSSLFFLPVQSTFESLLSFCVHRFMTQTQTVLGFRGFSLSPSLPSPTWNFYFCLPVVCFPCVCGQCGDSGREGRKGSSRVGTHTPSRLPEKPQRRFGNDTCFARTGHCGIVSLSLSAQHWREILRESTTRVAACQPKYKHGHTSAPTTIRGPLHSRRVARSSPSAVRASGIGIQTTVGRVPFWRIPNVCELRAEETQYSPNIPLSNQQQRCHLCQIHIEDMPSKTTVTTTRTTTRTHTRTRIETCSLTSLPSHSKTAFVS